MRDRVPRGTESWEPLDSSLKLLSSANSPPLHQSSSIAEMRSPWMVPVLSAGNSWKSLMWHLKPHWLPGHHRQVLPFHLWWEMGGREENEAWSCHSGKRASLSMRGVPCDQEMVPTAEQQAWLQGVDCRLGKEWRRDRRTFWNWIYHSGGSTAGLRVGEVFCRDFLHWDAQGPESPGRIHQSSMSRINRNDQYGSWTHRWSVGGGGRIFSYILMCV